MDGEFRKQVGANWNMDLPTSGILLQCDGGQIRGGEVDGKTFGDDDDGLEQTDPREVEELL